MIRGDPKRSARIIRLQDGLGGFITPPPTRPDYLDMAVDPLVAARRRREPIALISTTRCARAKPVELGLFDHIVPLPREYPRNIGDIRRGQPFDETLFLDADCLALCRSMICGNGCGLELALQGEVLTPAVERIHHMRSTRTLRRFGLQRYVKSNRASSISAAKLAGRGG